MTDLTSLTATALAAEIAARRLSATDAVRAYLDRIDRLNPALNAIIFVDAESSLRRAAALDARRSPIGRLHGVPMTLKDSHRVAGMPTMVGNPRASSLPARRDGFVADRLRAEGAILLGKTNVAQDLEDFQTDNPLHGRTNNPWDPARTPGGSSGGAAAALAARLTPLEIGSDIAGSIRVPAHFSGVIGLKPTAGTISSLGHVTQSVAHPRGGGVGALATIGPMARSCDDIRLALDVLGCPRTEYDDTANISIGVIPELPGLRVQATVRAALMRLIDTARGARIRTQEVPAAPDPVPDHEAWVAVYAAASRRGSSWRQGAAVSRLRQRSLEVWDRLFQAYDAVVMPPAMCTAFTHRPKGSLLDIDGAPVPYWGLARYTETFNLTGHPAIVVPIGWDRAGLPIGVQVIGRMGSDYALVRCAEQIAGHAERELAGEEGFEPSVS